MSVKTKYCIWIQLILILGTTLFLSCDKTNTLYEDRISGQIWVLYDQRQYSDDASVFAAVDTCVKDNSYRFFSDGSIVINEGKVKCLASDPIEQRGTWSFSDDKKQLTITDFKGNQVLFEILSLEKDRLKIRNIVPSQVIYKYYYKPR